MSVTLEPEGEEGEEELEIPLGMKWIGGRMDGYKKQREPETGDRWEVPVGMRRAKIRGVHDFLSRNWPNLTH